MTDMVTRMPGETTLAVRLSTVSLPLDYRGVGGDTVADPWQPDVFWIKSSDEVD